MGHLSGPYRENSVGPAVGQIFALGRTSVYGLMTEHLRLAAVAAQQCARSTPLRGGESLMPCSSAAQCSNSLPHLQRQFCDACHIARRDARSGFQIATPSRHRQALWPFFGFLAEAQ